MPWKKLRRRYSQVFVCFEQYESENSCSSPRIVNQRTLEESIPRRVNLRSRGSKKHALDVKIRIQRLLDVAYRRSSRT
jgi:hypothetical protein